MNTTLQKKSVSEQLRTQSLQDIFGVYHSGEIIFRPTVVHHDIEMGQLDEQELSASQLKAYHELTGGQKLYNI